MGIETVLHPPYSPDLAPCDFCLFPKLRGCLYETIEEMKEVSTKVIDTITEEDFHRPSRSCGTVQQVHCSRRILLRRGLEFHVCTINKSAPYEKILETYLMILVNLFTSRDGLEITDCIPLYKGNTPPLLKGIAYFDTELHLLVRLVPDISGM